MAYIVGRCLLKDLLKKADMTQVELAEQLGVTPQQIQNYIKKKDPRVMSLVVAKNISTILGCQIDDLYEWSKIE